MWDDPLLGQAFTEVKAICQRMKVKKLVLIEADAAVAREREVDETTALSTDIKGGGGTSFVPALEAAAKHEPNLTVYFTDLYGDFPEHCDFPVLWVTKTTDVEVPIGDILRVK
jgi:predicted metal-dependent peptidase